MKTNTTPILEEKIADYCQTTFNKIKELLIRLARPSHLECPSCNMTKDLQTLEDLYLELSQTHSSWKSKRQHTIIFDFFDTYPEGDLYYVLCGGCSRITRMVPILGIKLFLSFFRLAFPYKPLPPPSIDLFKVHKDINASFDTTGQDLELKGGFTSHRISLPQHIFTVLKKLKIFEIGELGMLMYGRNYHHRGFIGMLTEAESNDVNNRKKEIEENLKQKG